MKYSEVENWEIMAKVVIKCVGCGNKKRVTRKHRHIIGNQCVECTKEEFSRECISIFYNELY